MTASALSQQPRLGDGTPLALLRLADAEADLQRLVRVDHSSAEPVGDQILSARIDVPPGEWLLWSREACALWIGARADALPSPVRQRLTHGSVDELIDLLDQLAVAGVWCRDAAVLTEQGWSRPRRADAVFGVLAAGRAIAISGVFVDRSGHAARLEIARGAVCWTDRPSRAVQWLLTAAHLPLPT